MAGLGDFDKICFVLMPFGKKQVNQTLVDFDAIYDQVFAPAIAAARLPEGGNLEPRRTDRDKFSASISQDMFEYLEYSRFALADISGANANVFLELGVRYRARESGTIVVRQNEAPIPFDINQIKAFPYSYSPVDAAAESRRVISELLEESLKINRVDSPVRLALRAQRSDRHDVEPLLRDAEEALKNGDRATAAATLTQAVLGDPQNPLTHVKLGIVLKDQGELTEARQQFDKAIALDSGFGEAHRELGVIDSLWYRKSKDAKQASSSETALLRAIELNPRDFDALASLGGLYKRLGQPEKALDCYERSAKVSNGHPYPLLNAIRLEAIRDRKLAIDAQRNRQMRRAATQRQRQAEAHFDLPWALFDQAEICLYLGEAAKFQTLLSEGLDSCERRWQVTTFRDGLVALRDAGLNLPGLAEGLSAIDAQIDAVPE